MRSRLVVSNLECRMKLRKAFKRHKSRKYWAQKCQAYKHSGLSFKKFCRSQGLPTSSFHRWFKRLESEGALEGGCFIPVEVEDSPAMFVAEDYAEEVSADSSCGEEMPERSPDLKLVLGKGVVLTIPKGFDPVTLRQIVEVLLPC